jgi:WD40 repeat protein
MTPAPARGPGAPDAGAKPARPDVFISYSRRDQAFVEGTLLPAMARANKDVWIDLEDIPPASDWHERMLSGVAAANALVFVISPDSIASERCGDELTRAIEANKRIVPVMRRDTGEAQLPAALAATNWIFLRDQDDRDRGLALLIEALETDLAWRDTHSRLAADAAEWLGAGRDPSFLLRGSDLARAETWLAGQDEHAERATPQQAGYILASRQAVTRRQRVTTIGALAALAITSLLAVYALIQRGAADERARVASSRELAASSLSVLPRDPELAVLLADEAARRHKTSEAEEALRRALAQSHLALTLHAGAGPVTATFADHDRFVVTGGADGVVRVWDARSGRALAVMRGHRGTVLGVAASPDGRRVASAGQDGTARVWDRASGRPIAVLRGNRSLAYQPSFSPDGRLVLTAGLDGTARVWDAATGEPRAVLGGGRELFAARFDPRGERVLTAGASGTAAIWSVASRRRLVTMSGHVGAINNATFSPDGMLVATAGNDGTARVWSAASGRQLRLLRAGAVLARAPSSPDVVSPPAPSDGRVAPAVAPPAVARVNGVAFSPDSRRLVTTSDDGTAAVWSARSAKRLADLRGHVDSALRGAFSPDGALVVTSSADDTARVWDSHTGEQISVLRGHTDEVGPPKISADGSRVLTAADDGTARVWWLPRRAAPIVADREGLRGAQLSDDGSRLVTVGSSGVARVYDARSRRALRGFGAPAFFAADAAFLPSGRLAVTMAAAGDRAAEVVDVPSGRVLTTMRAAGARTRAISVSRDGRRVVTFGLDPDRELRVWDTASGRLVSSFEGTGTTASATLTPDGSHVIRGRLPEDFLSRALAGDVTGAFESWDVASGRLVATLPESPGVFSGVSFSPDGRRALLTTAKGIAPIWDMRSARAARVLRPRAQTVLAQVVSVDWSPRGDLAAVADRNRTGVVRVFDVATGAVRVELRHGTEVRHVAFSRDGRWLVTAGIDGVARVWEIASGEQVAELLGSHDALVAASFGPDARELLTASEDGSARVNTCELCTSLDGLRGLVAAHVSAGRRLTAAQRRTYLHEPPQ